MTNKKPKAARAQRKPAQVQAPRKPAADSAKQRASSGGWGRAALLGAAGAGVAALIYALTGKRDAHAADEDWPAHQVDGRNSSAQFDAQIADENMIPERVPEAIV